MYHKSYIYINIFILYQADQFLLEDYLLDLQFHSQLLSNFQIVLLHDAIICKHKIQQLVFLLFISFWVKSLWKTRKFLLRAQLYDDIRKCSIRHCFQVILNSKSFWQCSPGHMHRFHPSHWERHVFNVFLMYANSSNIQHQNITPAMQNTLKMTNGYKYQVLNKTTKNRRQTTLHTLDNETKTNSLSASSLTFIRPH